MGMHSCVADGQVQESSEVHPRRFRQGELVSVRTTVAGGEEWRDRTVWSDSYPDKADGSPCSVLEITAFEAGTRRAYPYRLARADVRAVTGRCLIHRSYEADDCPECGSFPPEQAATAVTVIPSRP